MTHARIFVPCSGQSGRGILSRPRKRDWGIRRADNNPAWWRARDKRDRQRLFRTYEDAERAALRLEAEARK